MFVVAGGGGLLPALNDIRGAGASYASNDSRHKPQKRDDCRYYHHRHVLGVV